MRDDRLDAFILIAGHGVKGFFGVPEHTDFSDLLLFLQEMLDEKNVILVILDKRDLIQFHK